MPCYSWNELVLRQEMSFIFEIWSVLQSSVFLKTFRDRFLFEIISEVYKLIQALNFKMLKNLNIFRINTDMLIEQLAHLFIHGFVWWAVWCSWLINKSLFRNYTERWNLMNTFGKKKRLEKQFSKNLHEFRIILMN